MARNWWSLELRQPPATATGKLLAATCLVLVGFFWFALTLGPAEERFISPAILPSPGEVIGAIPNLLFERNLGQSIAATMGRVLAGFSLALLIGVPLGVLAGSWRALDAFLKPVVIPMSNVPVAALIPLTILWFGIGETQKIMFIFVAAVPFVFATAAASILAVPDRYVDTARTLGASDQQIVVKVLVPTALPEMYRGLRGLFGLSFGYIMLAELINAPHGLGAMLNISQRRGLTEHIFLILAIIGLIAWAIDHGLAWVERRLFPYQAKQ
jgi:NitT/TauT family transport system permease protein